MSADGAPVPATAAVQSTQTPATEAKPAAVETPPAAEPKATPQQQSELEKAAALRKAAALEKRQAIAERNRIQEEKKQMSSKLQELERFEKMHANAKLNPLAFLQGIYGEEYWDIISEAKVHGVAPAKLVASEIDKMRADFDAKLQQRDADAQKRQAEDAQRALQETRRQLRGEAEQFWKSSGTEYSALEGIGGPEKIAQAITEKIESEYFRSEERHAETGEITRPGRVISVKEAAELIEGELLALAERMAGGAKYAEKLRAKLAPAPTSSPAAPEGATQRTDAPQRKTLSNDLTGSTQSKPAPLTKAERRARAEAAYREMRAKASG